MLSENTLDILSVAFSKPKIISRGIGFLLLLVFKREVDVLDGWLKSGRLSSINFPQNRRIIEGTLAFSQATFLLSVHPGGRGREIRSPL